MSMHHIQRSLINKLAMAEEASFSQLKDDSIDNKLFTYHLKLTIAQKYVAKNDNGKYHLTPIGKKMWKRISQKPADVANRALSVIYIALKNSNGKWLIYTRKTHPFLNYSAFPHINPEIQLSVVDSVKKFLDNTYSDYTDPSVRMSGFFKMIHANGEVESFTNFTLIYCETDEMHLPADSNAADFSWYSEKELPETTLLPNMPLLLEKLRTSQMEFIDQTIIIN